MARMAKGSGVGGSSPTCDTTSCDLKSAQWASAVYDQFGGENRSLRDFWPTHYGFVNFGDGTPLVRISAWLDKDRYQRPILTGSTQFPISKERDVADAASKPVPPPPPFKPAPTKSDRSGR